MQSQINPAILNNAIKQMREMDRYYRLDLWPKNQVADYIHDLHVMYAAGDLQRLTTELIGYDDKILLQHKIDLNAPSGRNREVVAYPIIDTTQVKSGRFVIKHYRNDASYQHRLRLRWSAAEKLKKRTADQYDAEKHNGRFHVSRDHRRVLVVKRVLRSGHAFGECPGIDEDVYLLPKFQTQPFRFHMGQRLTALVVNAGKGFQGRAIRAAC